ncbi:restriction endonuclease subunit S [Bacillus paramycoides]|uniref:restriction endonuclease subunit S n=1 Tax=Bacillus paramycoides TaxID=2026194 RepID=UPI003809138C
MSKVKLKDIASIQAGPFGTQLHKSEYVTDGILMLNAKNIGHGVIITESVDYVPETVCERLPKYVLKEGDILFGRAGSIEKHTYVNEEYAGCFQGTNCIRIRCHSKNIARYISYYLCLKDVKKAIENNTGGSVLSYISTDLLKDITVEIPDEKDVELVSRLLSTIDRKIETNNKINDNLAKQLDVIYNYWFTQFEFPDDEGKPYNSNHGAMEFNNKLKKHIPSGWLVQSVADNVLSTIIKPGVDKFVTKTYLPTSEVNGTNISDGNEIDYETRESRANMQPTINSVWFAKMKNSVKHLFLNKEMKPIIDRSILSTGFCGLQCTDVSLEYISSFIASTYFETLKDTLAHGATQEAVNNDDLNGISLVIPDNTTLSKYHETTKGIYSQISNNILENRELAQLRDWLLPMLMNGQVTII